MTPEEKQKIDALFAELTKNEVSFLREMGIPKNEHGVYAFTNHDGSFVLSLDMFLCHYKSWLIENEIVKQ